MAAEKTVVFHYEGIDDSDSFDNVPNMSAVQELTGKSIDEVFEDETLKARKLCGRKVCGLTGNFSTSYIEGDGGVAGPMIPYDTQIPVADGDVQCNRGDCSSNCVKVLRDRLAVLFDEAPSVVEACNAATKPMIDATRAGVADIRSEASRTAQTITDAAQDRANAILDPANAEANRVLTDAQTEISEKRDAAELLLTATRAEFYGPLLARVDGIR